MSMNELYVVCEVEGVPYAIKASAVVMLDAFVGAVKVPGTAEHVAGLVLVRGTHVPVVDLRARFGLPKVPVSMDHRVVVVQQGERRVALLADRAREVVKLDPTSIHPPPDVVVEQSSGFVTGVTRLGDRTILLLDVQRVIGGQEGATALPAPATGGAAAAASLSQG